jgi:hypothetical protein
VLVFGRLGLVVGVCSFLVACFGFVVGARAESGWWKLSETSTPTVLVPGGEARIVALAANIGDGSIAASEFAPVRISLSVPPWFVPLKVTGIAGPAIVGTGGGGLLGRMSCQVLPALSCSYEQSLPSFGTLEVLVKGMVSKGAPAGGAGEVTVEGGEALGASVTHRFVTGSSTPFGVESTELVPENEGGSVDLQAGSHPFQLTSTVGVNNRLGAGGEEDPVGPELLKDLRVSLPPGLVGDANAIAQCDDVAFTSLSEGAFNQCPADTAVGAALVTLNEPRNLHYKTFPLPIFNLTPERGEPARFGFDVQGLPVVLNTSVRTGSDYGVTVNASDLSELGALVRATLVFWGVPGEASHDAARGSSCIAGGLDVAIYGAPEESCDLSEPAPTAFLTLPPSCVGSFQSTVEMESWERQGLFTKPVASSLQAGGEASGLGGCDALSFDPSVSVVPDSKAASTPAGFDVDLHVSQEQALTPHGIVPADAQSITVVLPPGVQVNPAAAGGLGVCSVAEIGLETSLEAACPESSKVATAEVVTPLLNHPLQGAVYAAAQNENPFGSLLALYLVVKDPISGVLLKLAGEVSPNPVTGQLTVTFSGLPELPFQDATIRTFDSPRSVLSTPSLCGAGYTSEASLLPSSGGEPVSAQSLFEIGSGVGGGGCVAPEPFAPGFQAGTTDVQAGAFSPLVVNVTRPDGDQALKEIGVRLPPGLLADIANVPLCGEPAAGLGECPASSLIGKVGVQAGLGSEPVTVEGGRVFLTGPYDGAPFGLSIVTTAKAGPFDLGVVKVRAAINIDPATAAVSVSAGAIPSILQGIPLQVKALKVTIERPGGFAFNPTDCAAKTITGDITSANALSITAPVSSSFRAANCATLAFKPRFSFSTTSKYSKKLGASLHVKVSYPKAAFGTQANIAKVKIDLPIQLPSRQSTFKYACPAATFAASPAACPKHSIVGYASAVTPVLPVPVKGNAYLVSHAGESIPNVVLVLQGDGVTVDLAGTTHIKNNVTSNTFSAVPDVPVSSFEATFTQSEYSLFAGYQSFCATTLKAPVAMQAQNGVEIHETDTFTVTGCPRHKTPAKKGKK